MSAFIPIAVAHDATCDKGDEWFFHGMTEGKETPKKLSAEERIEEEKADLVATAIVVVLVALIGIGILLFNLIAG